MPRLIQVLLALSLLLNAFFVAGFVFRSWVAPLPFERQMPPPPPPGQRPSALEIVTNDVNLDDSQRQALRGVFEQYSAARRERFRDIQKLREQIIAEYKRTPLDRARLEPLIDKLGELRTDQQKETLRSLAQVEAQLKPEQRERMHQILAERLLAGPPPRPPGGPGRPSQ
jgi:Spy/CpxP family protein refolding chaperone